MPYTDPEARKAYAAAYRAKNREKAREYAAMRRATPDYQAHVKDPDARRRGQARYVAAHPERVRESSRISAAKERANRTPEKALEVCIYQTFYSMRKQREKLEQRVAEMVLS